MRALRHAVVVGSMVLAGSVASTASPASSSPVLSAEAGTGTAAHPEDGPGRLPQPRRLPAAGEEPVPMPRVRPVEPGPVPMPLVRPTPPGPVEMPQLRPEGSRILPEPVDR